MTNFDSWLTTDLTDEKFLPVTQDIYKEDVYLSDVVYDTGAGVVLQKNMKQYIAGENELKDGATGWVTYFDGMEGNIEEYDTILIDGHYLSEDTIPEFLSFHGWQAIEYRYL